MDFVVGYFMSKKEKPNPRAIALNEIIKETLENLLKTKRRKTIATNESAIKARLIDNPNQNERKIIKIITRVKSHSF